MDVEPALKIGLNQLIINSIRTLTKKGAAPIPVLAGKA